MAKKTTYVPENVISLFTCIYDTSNELPHFALCGQNNRLDAKYI